MNDTKDSKHNVSKDNEQQHGVHESASVQGEGKIDDSAKKEFRFGRMFPCTKGAPIVLNPDAFTRIGEAMTVRVPSSENDSNIPAGYTYFGQFVDHDITFDGTGDLDTPGGQVADDQLLQQRSPSLDLDSLYGKPNAKDSDKLFEPNSAVFKIGSTSPADGISPVGSSINYDLPRTCPRKANPAMGRPVEKKALQADIGDPRNDENLAVAQTHLMWLKFHNHVVGKVKVRNPQRMPMILCAEAREIVTRHYQYIVLNDFAKRFIDPEVYQDVIVEGNRKHFDPACCEVPFMPLEFSVAAYRHGHSQVREEYDWNINFGPNGAAEQIPSPFSLLFRFSELSGDFFDNPRLPTNWVPDFRRLFDFGKRSFPNLKGSKTGSLNMAKRLDPFLASDLSNLPELQARINPGAVAPQFRLPSANLAALNLRKGSMRLLPSGQDISREMSNVKMLSTTEIKNAAGPILSELLEELGLLERTPLWLYILLEASARGEGNHLGPLGSTIVAETFVTLVLTSRISILRGVEKWNPSHDQALLEADEPLESIPAILAWMDEQEAIVDPLQDKRIIESQMMS